MLGDEPVSARQACRDVFGEGFPNVHRTLGNLYKKTFDGDSIGLARKLSRKVRQERLKQLDEEWITMGKPGNPQHVPYLTPDEEELVVSFLKTCNFMHMPFNRDAFKVSRYSLMHAHQSHTHISHASQGLVCSIAQANDRHTDPVVSDYYVRSFLKKHPELAEIKTSVMGHHRAKQATAEVRDAVFKKLEVCVCHTPIMLIGIHTHTHPCLLAGATRTSRLIWNTNSL